ncbi:MAG: glycosyltransferase family 4 protein [Rhodothermus sp.]|nr:glycosyltransferase family 4 protein [Rhodothermus sp.]
MQVLQLGSGWFEEVPGGLERVYAALCRHLPETGVHCRGVVMGSEAVARATGGKFVGAARPSAPLWQRWQGMRRAVQRLRHTEPFDLVAAHFALYTFPVLDLVRDLPLVVHFHGPWAWEGREEVKKGIQVAVKAWLERVVYRRAVRCIVLSKAFGRELTQRYGVVPERIRVVPGGVAVERFARTLSRREARQVLGWPSDRPIVLSVRRLVRRMGLERLIAAMAAVRRHVPEILLLIAGRGPLREALQAQIEALGLQRHVRLLGFVPDEQLPLAYRAADLTIVPTVALEGFGLITLESLAAGTPVLVTPIGGLPEAVQGLSEALVLEAATSEALADGLIDALTGRRPLPSDEACRTYVRQHYDWSVIARKVKAVYEEAVQIATG